MSDKFDVVVVGAGMAGASVAAAIGASGRVLVLEAEDRPGVHSTGRSAAVFAPGYGAGAVRVLTNASASTFFAKTEGAPSLVIPRPQLHIAEARQRETLNELHRSDPSTYDWLSGEEVEGMVPVFRPGKIAAALIDSRSADIDVEALHQRYLRAFRKAGGELATSEPVIAMHPASGSWRVLTPLREVTASIVVNAAGAWAEKVALLAGLQPIGLQPKRRTAALVDAPSGFDVSGWPIVLDVDERFYFKPDAGRLLVSPAEETDVEPHDAYADDEALAEGIERIAQLTTIEVTRAPKAWAGLRTFAPDRVPVVGFELSAAAPFYWIAGQGGYGIQTAPAIAELASRELQSRSAPSFADAALKCALSPCRFRN